MVGSSGVAGLRTLPVEASPRTLPAWTVGTSEPPPNIAVTSPATSADRSRPAAAIRHVDEIDADVLLEHLHGEMVLAAVADRGIEQRRLGAARELDEFAQSCSPAPTD